MGVSKYAVVSLLIAIEVCICLNVTKLFHQHAIVPDTIDKAPEKLVFVKFPDGSEAKLGNALVPALTVNQPELSWAITTPDELYTLVMVDPDAPSRNIFPFRDHGLHWLVGNIPGQNIAKGDQLASYKGPTPPKDKGHRYVILVYKQDGEINFSERWKDSDTSRKKFDVANFTATYGLGNPIAGNFFYS